MKKTKKPWRQLCEQQIAFTLAPDVLKACITDPEKILAYYPMPIAVDVAEQGKAFICRGWLGCTLLEVVDVEDIVSDVTLKVTSAYLFKPPYSAERIKQHAFFSMYERHYIEQKSQGSLLRKQWGNLTLLKYRFLPIAWLVRRTAKGETALLQKHW